MKISLVILALMLAAGGAAGMFFDKLDPFRDKGIGAGTARLSEPGQSETEELLPGGTLDSSKASMPKIIESTELSSFSLSYLNDGEAYAEGEEEVFDYGIYELSLKEEAGKALCELAFMSRYAEDARRASFTVDAAELSSLERLIRENDYASMNGHDKWNSALGTLIDFSADYASGEKLRIHAEGGAATRPVGFNARALLDFFDDLALRYGQERLKIKNPSRS